MTNFKQIIANQIAKATDLDEKELEAYIEIPKDVKNGDYAFPCFRLAKILKKSPQQIASEIKEKIEIDTNIIEKVEVLSGYLNFYINKQLLTKEILTEITQSITKHYETTTTYTTNINVDVAKIELENLDVSEKITIVLDGESQDYTLAQLDGVVTLESGKYYLNLKALMFDNIKEIEITYYETPSNT